MKMDSVVSVTQEQVSANLSDETVILNLNTGVYFGLNSIGTSIWKLLQTPVPVKSICDSIIEEYNVTPDRCEKDVIDLLGKLADAGLVEINNE